MKIISKKEFLQCPVGTIFSKYQPCVFEDLSIKGESLLETNDFFYQNIIDALDSNNSDEFVQMCDAAHNFGASIDLNFDVEMRDGLYDDNQLFAIWEDKDVTKLITRLQVARDAK